MRDGDTVTLGETSVLKVHITATPAPAAGGAAAVGTQVGVAAPLTVEAFLQAQCEQLVSSLQARLVHMYAPLRAWCVADAARVLPQSKMEAEMLQLRAEADAAIAELQEAVAE